jgi:hypothetical protein
VQVAFPVAFTVTALHPEIVLPLAVKFTAPEGTTGVKATPASCAVKVTESLTIVELDGDAVTPSVAASAETDCVAEPAVATVKLLSFE